MAVVAPDIAGVDGLTGQTAGWRSEYVMRVPAEQFSGGTGGLSLDLDDATGRVVILVNPEVRSEPDRMTSIQDFVRSTFGLESDEALARTCHVSRKTLHNWRGEAVKPRKKGVNRLLKLYQAASNWRDAGYIAPDDVSRQETVGGKTLDDLLLADELDNDAIQFLGSRMSMPAVGNTELSDPFG